MSRNRHPQSASSGLAPSAPAARRAVQVVVALGLVTIAASASAQDAEATPEGPLAQLPSLHGQAVDEAPLPPAAFFQPLTATATRSRVTGTVKRPEDGVATLTLANRNPFPVRVYDFTACLDDPCISGLYRTGAAVDVPALSWVEVSLSGAAPRTVTRTRLAAMRAHRVRFAMTPEPEIFEALSEQALTGEDGAPGVVDGAITAMALRRFLATEAEANTNVGYPTAELTEGADALATVLPTLASRACEAELRQVATPTGVPAATMERIAALVEADLGDEALGCFDEGAWGTVATDALETGESALALRVARRYEAGARTPSPFREVLVRDAIQRLDAAEALLRQSDQRQELAAVEPLADAFDAVNALQRVAPDHPRLSDRVALTQRTGEQIAARVDGLGFEDAAVLLELLQRAVDASGTGAEQALVRSTLDDADGLYAYSLGKFYYHHRRTRAEDRAQAHALLDRGAVYAPVRARVYQLGLVFVEYQFTAIFGLIGLVLAGLGFARSRAFERLRARGGLWRAAWLARAGQRHGALEAYWSVLSRMLGADQPGPADRRLQAAAAVGVLDMAQTLGDPREAQEARNFLQRIEPALRPPMWRSPEAPLLEMDVLCRGRVDGASLGRVIANAELIEQLFGDGPEARLARAMTLDARCRADAAQRAPYDDASQAYDALMGADVPDAVQRRAVRRAAMLTAQRGPALLDDPACAWTRVWSLLRHDPPAADDHGLMAGWTMAVAVAAPLDAGLPVFEEAAGALSPTVLDACLREAALRAKLPESDADLKALATLDDLITEHLRGPDALDARLRLAVLRRLGGATSGADGDVRAFVDDRDALLAEARRQTGRPTTVALAAVLDLLTPGDFGFDRYAEQSRGAERTLFALIEALDHTSAGRHVEAASVLANADPYAEGIRPARACRLQAARATVAAAMGLRRPALLAVARGLEIPGAAEVDRRVLGRTAARLLPWALAEDALEPHTALLEAAALAILDDPTLAWPRLSLSELGGVLAGVGARTTAARVLERAAEVDGAALAPQRAAAWHHLCRLAVAARDYTNARQCAIVAEGQAVRTAPRA